jgi:hypothetical protein
MKVHPAYSDIGTRHFLPPEFQFTFGLARPPASSALIGQVVSPQFPRHESLPQVIFCAACSSPFTRSSTTSSTHLRSLDRRILKHRLDPKGQLTN